jgi:hypothetical protein
MPIDLIPLNYLVIILEPKAIGNSHFFNIFNVLSFFLFLSRTQLNIGCERNEFALACRVTTRDSPLYEQALKTPHRVRMAIPADTQRELLLKF